MWVGVTARGVAEQTPTSDVVDRPEVSDPRLKSKEVGHESPPRSLAALDDLQGYGGTSEALIGSRQLTSDTGLLTPKPARQRRPAVPTKRKPKAPRRQQKPSKKRAKAASRKAGPQRRKKPALLPGAVI